MSNNDKFLCINCGRFDKGTYCSNCRHPLRIVKEQLNTLLAKRLIRYDYVDLKLDIEHSFPYKELTTKLCDLSDDSEELLAFEGLYSMNRFVLVIAMINADQRTESDVAQLAIDSCDTLTR